MAPDEIVDAHPHLTLTAVHAALAYFYDHLGEIRGEWRNTDAFVAKMKSEHARLYAKNHPGP